MKRQYIAQYIKAAKSRTSGAFSKVLLGLLGIAFLFPSCQDVIDLNLPDGDTVLVVEGRITNDSTETHQVALTYSSPYFKDQPAPVASGAFLELTDETDNVTYSFTETPAGSGVYVTTAVGQVGHVYSLYIRDNSTNEEYRSIPEEMNFVPEITSIYSEFIDDGDIFDEEGWSVFIETFEPAGKGDHYRWRSTVDGNLLDDPFDIFVASDDLVDGNIISELDMVEGIEFKDELEDGDDENLVIIGKDSIEVVIEQSTISERAFEFYNLIQQQTAFVGGPFDSPPAPIRGNVKNTEGENNFALGYFLVSAVEKASITIVNQ